MHYSDRAYCRIHGAIQTPGTGSATMSDKSPRQTMTKKSGKSLKDKRADKKLKADRANHPVEEIKKR
jgi:hypothetical protein